MMIKLDPFYINFVVELLVVMLFDGSILISPPGERYKAYHEEAERIVTELGASVWDLPSGCLDNEQMSGSPATLYISGEPCVCVQSRGYSCYGCFFLMIIILLRLLLFCHF